MFTYKGISSEKQKFDRCFSIDGAPREYLQRAVDLICRSEPGLLAWMIHYRPSIELKGENIYCWQNGEFTDLNSQIALLNLLCDLADLAECMEREMSLLEP